MNFLNVCRLMRQAYLEMAMTFMGAIGTPGVPLPPGTEAKTPDNPLYRETTVEKRERESKKDPSPPSKKATKVGGLHLSY